jgi:hypothetical protein
MTMAIRSKSVIDLEMPLALVRAKIIGAAQVRILAAVEGVKRRQNKMPNPQKKARGGVHDTPPRLR